MANPRPDGLADWEREMLEREAQAMTDDPQLVQLADYPLEVTLVDGSRWIIYYRGRMLTFAECMTWLEQDVRENRRMPAEDPDGVQRRSGQIFMGHVVSVREVER